MTLPEPKELLMTTLRQPRVAARQILDLRVAPQIMWLLLAFIAVVGGFVHGVTLVILPAPDEAPMVFASPLLFSVFLAIVAAVSAYALTFVGKGFGGRASFEDVLSLVIWLQIVNVVVQVVTLLLMVVSVSLSSGVSVVASLWAIWLMVHFFEEAQQFGSLFKSFLVVILASFAAAFGATLLSLLLGALFH